jgi:hypothetical protein
MKKISLILLTVLASLLPESAVANSSKSLVIIDSGIATLLSLENVLMAKAQ